VPSFGTSTFSSDPFDRRRTICPICPRIEFAPDDDDDDDADADDIFEAFLLVIFTLSLALAHAFIRT
jgi:hypothetical protein